MKQTNKIFSISYSQDLLTFTEIQTVVSGGMYRFEILGLNQKSAAELKQKVYTALRSENLLNLKSDNRKIYTSIQGDGVVDVVQPTELAVLTSCYNCITKKNFHNNSLILGRISISGEVLPTNILIQCIHIAIENNMKTIVCPESDFNKIPTRIIDYVINSGISIKTVSNIKDLFISDTGCVSTPPLPKEDVEIRIVQDTVYKIRENEFLWSLFVSMCGDHDLLLFINKTVDTSMIMDTISHIHPEYTEDKLLELSHKLNIKDTDIKTVPYFTEYTERATHKNILKQIHYHMNCPCENPEKDCTCNVRLKKNYKTKLLRLVEQTHTIKTSLETNETSPLNEQEMQYIKKLIQKIQTTSYENNLPDSDVLDYYHTVSAKMSAQEKRTVLSVAKTIQKIDSVIENKLVDITKKTILLAFSMVRSRLN